MEDIGTGSSPIEWLIRLLLILFTGVSAPAPSPPAAMPPAVPDPIVIEAPGDAAMQAVDAVVESVEVLRLESLPVQLQLIVTGYHPDGCEVPMVVEQQRDGNHVSVRLYRELPGDVMCPMVIVPFEETIKLEGGFETGTYTIDVNGFVTEVTI